MLDPARPGYAAIAAVRLLGPDDPALLLFVEKTLGLPAWMLPAVFRTMHHVSWRQASDPIASLRKNAKLLALRIGLSGTAPAVAKSE